MRIQTLGYLLSLPNLDSLTINEVKSFRSLQLPTDISLTELVMKGQRYHHFDIDRFCGAVKRILKLNHLELYLNAHYNLPIKILKIFKIQCKTILETMKLYNRRSERDW